MRTRVGSPGLGGATRARAGGESADRSYPWCVASDDDLFGQSHVRAYRESDGEHGYHWRGNTILLLTTTGRVSGTERTTPLIHRIDDDRWVVVASKGGAPDHPDWYKNLEAQPEATIQVKGERIPVRAQTARAGDRERLWQLMNEDWPSYNDYQQGTSREIPVVVLERK
jgi:deazaflavin-dependent oxidoreductase (nitroreductase family)